MMNVTVTATHSLLESYHHTATLMYEQRDWSNPREENWDNVTDTYYTRLRVDEHANTPDDTVHLSTLPVQTAWSENNSWVNGAYVQITPSESIKSRTYKLSIFRARPVTLVHRIECYPREESDLRVVPARNAMGHGHDYLPWDALAYPCVCHNFCWDSYKEGLNSDGSGVLQEILTLIDETYEQHDFPVVLIGHSMGGHFVSVGCVRPAGVHQNLPSD